MRVIFFCQNPYAFGIMEPIMEVLKKRGDDYLWYVGVKINSFPFSKEPHTRNIADLKEFASDVIFVPGNEVPHYLRGLKVQIFHGLAGEKKGHFRIRHYFDLYLTQGPYFTNRFNELKLKYRNFEVIETGWPKLDIYGRNKDYYNDLKENYLEKYKVEKILLYAPTFSPSLTSAPFLLDEIKRLAADKKYLVLIKFHDLMSQELINSYKKLADETETIIFETEKNIIKFLLVADLLMSDTSSVVYEFLLLDKPVVTYRSSNSEIFWDNQESYVNLKECVEKNLDKDPFKEQRSYILKNYHPYTDGQSAERMVNTVEVFIKERGVPERRKLSFYRRYKIKKLFGK